MRRPIALGFLVFFLLFLAEGGLHGGIAMVLDPSRGTLEMTEVLPSLPVPDDTLPAQFVLVAMGAVPLGLAYGLRARPAWARAESLSRAERHHWAWRGALALRVVLMDWLVAQAFLIGFRWPIQFITSARHPPAGAGAGGAVAVRAFGASRCGRSPSRGAAGPRQPGHAHPTYHRDDRLCQSSSSSKVTS